MTYTLDKPQHFTHAGLDWQKFKALQQAFTDLPGVRINYFNGDVEILSVSPQHGIIAGNLGFLIELWMLEQGIAFVATEDMTVERKEVASAQGDKSYCFPERQDVPDLSIEVVISGEGETKLARYRALGVSEVWFWQDNRISIHQLKGNSYESVEASQYLPGLNISLLAACVVTENRAAALAQFKEG
jgi:Uma2 family endonuclease